MCAVALAAILIPRSSAEATSIPLMDADAGHLTQVHEEPFYLAFAALPGYHGAAVLNICGYRSYPPISVLPPSCSSYNRSILQTQTRRCTDQDSS